MAILIDTNIFVALSNNRDVNHQRAETLIERSSGGEFGKAYTSDYIFDETVTTAFVRTKNRKKSIELGESILDSEVDMLPVDRQAFEIAWELFKKYGFSFTDCSSLAIMKLYGIKKLMTFDREFKRIGWVDVVE